MTDLVGHGDLLSGRDCEVPGMDEELQRQDIRGEASRHVPLAAPNGAFETALVPGLQRLLGRERHPGLQGAGLGWLHDRSGHAAESNQRPDQVVGELADGELAAGGGPVEVNLIHPTQNVLAHKPVWHPPR